MRDLTSLCLRFRHTGCFESFNELQRVKSNGCHVNIPHSKSFNQYSTMTVISSDKGQTTVFCLNSSAAIIEANYLILRSAHLALPNVLFPLSNTVTITENRGLSPNFLYTQPENRIYTIIVEAPFRRFYDKKTAPDFPVARFFEYMSGEHMKCAHFSCQLV